MVARVLYGRNNSRKWKIGLRMATVADLARVRRDHELAQKAQNISALTAFLNIESFRMNPIPVDPVVWSRMGYTAAESDERRAA